MSEQKRQLIWFGFNVKAAFETAQRLFSHSTNPVWIVPDKLPSGANVSGMLYSIWMRSWIPYGPSALAKAAIRQGVKREKKNFKEGEIRQAVLARNSSYKFVDSYFHPWWATFCYLGLPAGDKCRQHFQSGKAVCFMDLSDIRTEVRRHLQTPPVIC